jgi:hypothetical protein
MTTYVDAMTGGLARDATFLRAHLGPEIVQATLEEAALTMRVLCIA